MAKLWSVLMFVKQPYLVHDAKLEVNSNRRRVSPDCKISYPILIFIGEAHHIEIIYSSFHVCTPRLLVCSKWAILVHSPTSLEQFEVRENEI